MADRIELVRWIDSASVNTDWDSVDEVIDSSNGHAELYHQTAGFLIFEDDVCIIITRDLQDAHDSLRRQAGDSIKIPKVAILSREELSSRSSEGQGTTPRPFPTNTTEPVVVLR